MTFLLPETVLLIAFMFIMAAIKKNFFIPAAGAAYGAYFGLTQIDHTNDMGAYLLSGMIILFVCACCYSFAYSYDNNNK